MVALPMEAREVTREELDHEFPTVDVLTKWHAGEEAEWPPEDDLNIGAPEMPPLRFNVGQNVLCRVGPTEWHKGVIVQQWYRETTWPAGAWAPYKVALEDGRSIFAPGDMDQIIKAAPP
mmetsp:Transcript_10218/g.15687  ORF Transcript_10218/g.15687 Transcript_10218/m.15687 type:complete len:119 (-) Transcript_10218:29-385(-)